MSGGNGADAGDYRIQLSRTASRRELAAQVHDVIVPLLKQQDHNLRWLKQQFETLEARVAALEPKTEA